MLPKKNRADTRAVEQIFKQGKFLNSPHLTFKFLTSPKNERKISFIVPKSVAKLAVKRNFLRRIGYDALKKYLPDFPTRLVGVFIFKKYQTDSEVIENEIKNILHQIN
jgi:ribonuclease P protein component